MESRPSLTVAVVFERRKSPSQWEEWGFRVVDVVVDNGQFGAQSRVLRDDGNVALIVHPGLSVALFRDEAEGYYLNLTAGQPVWFVMWRTDENDASRAWPEIVTLSYNEAARFLDAQERVDNVPLGPDVHELLRLFTDENYKPEPRKRRRPASFLAPDKR
jgi:hypothetical protein